MTPRGSSAAAIASPNPTVCASSGRRSAPSSSMPEVDASSTTAVPFGASAVGGKEEPGCRDRASVRTGHGHRHPRAARDGRRERIERALAAVSHRPREDLRRRIDGAPPVGERVRYLRCGDRPLEAVGREHHPQHWSAHGRLRRDVWSSVAQHDREGRATSWSIGAEERPRSVVLSLTGPSLRVWKGGRDRRAVCVSGPHGPRRRGRPHLLVKIWTSMSPR